jgi:S1-C subfamily serine protease
MVMVEFDVPYPTAGVQDLNYRGVGTIVDPEKGLVLVDRDTVPVGMGDIEITFADAVRVPGSLAYLHPTHNLAVVSYDPSLLGDLPVSAIRLSDQVAQEGDKFQVVGLNRDGGFVEEKVVVEKVGAIKMLPASAPRFRDSNLDVLKIDTDHSVLGGLVVDKKGAAVAMWASFFDPGKDSRHYYGLPTSAIRPVVDALVAGKTVDYHVLGAEFTGLSFAEARDRGVSDARLLALQERDRNYRKVLQVFRRLGGSPAATLLKDADILIAVDGDPVNRMAQLDALWDRESVELTIVRDGEELNIELESTVVSGKGIERIGLWAGMIVHEPHYEIAAQRGMNPEGVYVAWMWYGSPASRYGLRATRRILAINDEPIPDLDTFFAVVGSIDGSESVRVLMEGLDGSQRIDTLRLDQHYWPTEVVQREGDGWSRKPLSGSL